MENDTQQDILDQAQEFVQRRGYNAFSFRSLAEAVGVKSSSVHYHFSTKGDLGVALMQRLRRAFQKTFAEIDAAGADPPEKLRRYVEAFTTPLKNGSKVCMGGMLAADAETLPEEVQRGISGFVADHERFLTGVLQEGQASGDFAFEDAPETRAQALFSALEGASVLAHALGDPARLRRTADALTNSLCTSR